MRAIADCLSNLFARKRDKGMGDAEELRNAFRARYHHFKLLLNANNKALDIMAEMGEALRGNRAFGMAFVQSRCIGVSTSVWQIIRNLNELAPGKYKTLFGRLKEIQDTINPYLVYDRAFDDGPLVVPLEAADRSMANLVGGKIANLGEVRRAIGLSIPDGFAITAVACRRFLAETDLQVEIDRRIQAADVEGQNQLDSLSAGLQQLIVQSPVPTDLERAILEHHGQLAERHGESVRVAVRSSAVGEDLAGTSPAGQYRTVLNVSRRNIITAYKEVVASRYCLEAMDYRLTRGIPDDDVPMCVGCMPMVEAVSGGVAYSRSPVIAGDDVVAIYSAWGLPKSVVDGIIVPDVFAVSRAEPMAILGREISAKVEKTVCDPVDGISHQKVTGEDRQRPSLSDEKVLELARIAARVEDHFGVPQDIEWAIDENQTVKLLQCRPLQQVESPVAAERRATDVAEAGLIVRGGISAGPGVASGPVFTVGRDADALQFPEGAVLVTRQALPRWATMLGRAAAVVTEQGSLAGHLASVAREYGVPALFGVEHAFSKLRSGQPVTVDADGCCIYEGRVESLLTTQREPSNLMEGSRVFEVLKRTASHITPLGLLDPDAPTFRPANCRTLHDITRLCHEYAVKEMFHFGKEHTFPERSSKQLLCDVPMQWWILNLDDGFEEEVMGSQVHLGTIVSVPMLALWEGITASPWEGPPPVDGKGFLSVMFEATRNTALVPSMRSSYADRNYFMISRNYCSLNSRLGFHFSIVESLVSKRARENYISFRFKGGAADSRRKGKRTVFIAELLEDYGFRVEVKEDSLSARLERHELDFVITRLKILGYLIIHTRQLDMIMSNGAMVSYYRSRIQREIQDMLGGCGTMPQPDQ